MNLLELTSEKINDNEAVVYAKGYIDTETSESFSDYINRLHSLNKDIKINIDFSNVKMITSACVRCLLQFHKSGYNYELKGISKEIFTVLKITGVSAILNIKQETFSINTEGCKVLGRGFHSEVYRLDEETIAKIYFEKNEIDNAINERIISKQAFIKGVPTEISFALCESNGRPGLIYELVDANTLLSIFVEDINGMEKYITDYVNLVKSVHTFDNVGMTGIYDKKKGFINEANFISKYIPKECYERIIRLKDEIPDSNRLVHGDPHPANVMLTDKGMIFIDLSDMGFGDEKFDLMFLYRTLKLFPMLPNNKYALKEKEAAKLWDLFIKEYYKDEDESYIESQLIDIKLLALNSIINRFCLKNPRSNETIIMINNLIETVRNEKQ